MKTTSKLITALTGLFLGITFSVNAQVTTANTTNTYATTAYVGSSTTSTFKDIVFKTNNVERMRILGTGTTAGNIGIGTTAPLQKLHVVGNILINGAASSLFFGEGTTANAEWGIEYDLGGTNQTNGLNFWKPFGSSGVGFRNFILFINNNGRVGINTNHPTASLTVVGNALIGDTTTKLPAGYKLYVQTGILTEKVKIAVANSTDWSDYVFAKDYKLKTIEELEAFVKENKHLPNVPSAEEVVKEGIDMAKMDAKLLEKIEELSLYVIQLKKENTELVKRIERVENK